MGFDRLSESGSLGHQAVDKSLICNKVYHGIYHGAYKAPNMSARLIKKANSNNQTKSSKRRIMCISIEPVARLAGIRKWPN